MYFPLKTFFSLTFDCCFLGKMLGLGFFASSLDGNEVGTGRSVEFWGLWFDKVFFPIEARPKAEPVDLFAKSSGIRTTKMKKKF